MRRHSETGITLLEEAVIPAIRVLSMIYLEWARFQDETGRDSIAQVRQQIATHRKSDSKLNVPYMMGLLAELYRQVGEIQAGLDALEDALRLSHLHENRWWEAELYRLQGELWLQQEPPDHSQAEAALLRAVAVAQEQQAKSLELRAATSLARMWRHTQQADRARNMLEPVYQHFTEGHDTADLQDAKALLEALSARSG